MEHGGRARGGIGHFLNLDNLWRLDGDFEGDSGLLMHVCIVLVVVPAGGRVHTR